MVKFFENYWRKFFQNQLLAGSAIMFIGTMVANGGNYLYHLLMGRMLGPKGYGNLASVIALTYFLSIFLGALGLVITKLVASLKGKKDLRGISYLFSYFNRRLFILGALIALIMALVSPLAVDFLHLDSVVPLVLVGFLFIATALSSANRAILQGLLRFKELVASHISETSLKVVAGVVLVLAGFRVEGAVLALLLAGLLGYLLTILFLRSVRKRRPQKPDFSQKIFLRFGLPVFLSNLSFTSLYTSDVILVKHYFSSEEAGWYAALAVLGKIIFFATSPIVTVMFPMAAGRHSRGGNSYRLLLASLGLVFLLCLGGITVYFFLPELMVSLLFGQEYLVVAPLLIWVAISLSLYSFAFLLTNFFLSIEKTKVVILPPILALSQLVLIYFYHQSLLEVIQVSLAACGFLLLGLVLYLVYDQAKTALGDRAGF